MSMTKNIHSDHSSGIEADDGGIFSIRGNLDGERSDTYTEREQYIGLKVGDDEFYMAISSVHEIIMRQAITYVPGVHVMIEGVINLRGTIMPALNLRKMMGMPKGGSTPATRMIITYFQDSPVAIVVDGITYVVSLLPSQVEEQVLPSKSKGSDFISSIGKTNDRVIGIFDIQKIINSIVTDEVEEELPAVS